MVNDHRETSGAAQTILLTQQHRGLAEVEERWSQRATIEKL